MRSRAFFITALLMSVAAVTAPIAQAAAQDGISVELAADSLYVVTGTGGNVAFLVTAEGVLVVDSGTRTSHGDSILAEIERKTGEPVRYLVFTHYHLDHVGGASAFPDEVTVVSHENLPANQKNLNEPRLREMIEKTYPDRIAEAGKTLSSPDAGEEEIAKASAELEKLKMRLAEAEEMKLVYPDRTYRDAMTITLGGHEIRLIYPGPAHTGDNTVVHFVDLGTVHAGDMLFNRRNPYIDWKGGCDTENWIAALERISSWDVDTVIPGHGDITDRSGLAWKVGYLEDLRSEVGAAVKKGMTLEEAKKAVKMEKYSGLPYSYMLEAGIEAVYNELTGAAR